MVEDLAQVPGKKNKTEKPLKMARRAVGCQIHAQMNLCPPLIICLFCFRSPKRRRSRSNSRSRRSRHRRSRSRSRDRRHHSPRSRSQERRERERERERRQKGLPPPKNEAVSSESSQPIIEMVHCSGFTAFSVVASNLKKQKHFSLLIL